MFDPQTITICIGPEISHLAPRGVEVILRRHVQTKIGHVSRGSFAISQSIDVETPVDSRMLDILFSTQAPTGDGEEMGMVS